MSTTRMRTCAIAIALVAGLAAAQTPVTSAFTYQGRLADAAGPADGPFDFVFQLWSAPTGGTMIGSIVRDDLPVADGLFTASLDFGPTAFDGDARWLEIHVRPGAAVSTPTVLSPRQALTAVPYAAYALRSAQWHTTGSGITNGGSSFVGINRATPVNGAEFFGVQAPVQSGYGGMYMRTDGAGAKPFYGYQTGAETAWTYLDGATGNWNVYNDGDRLTVTDDGRVGIGTTDPAARLQVVGGGLADGLYASNSGSGRAAQFLLPAGSTNHTLYAANYGSGKAAMFESHVANSTPAVTVYKNGGTAIKTTGDVEVDGEVRTRFGSGMARGTPIAFGKFQVITNGIPLLISGSGNVIVTGLNNVFTVSVIGENEPENWMVMANLAYSEVYNPTPAYRLIQGSPNANGSFLLRLRCVENCGSTPNSDKFIHFVVFKP